MVEAKSICPVCKVLVPDLALHIDIEHPALLAPMAKSLMSYGGMLLPTYCPYCGAPVPPDQMPYHVSYSHPDPRSGAPQVGFPPSGGWYPFSPLRSAQFEQAVLDRLDAILKELRLLREAVESSVKAWAGGGVLSPTWFTCKFCGAGFSDEGECLRHIKEKHGGG